MAQKLNQEVVSWICHFHNERPLNIVMVDHYHTSNVVNLVIGLNTPGGATTTYQTTTSSPPIFQAIKKS